MLTAGNLKQLCKKKIITGTEGLKSSIKLTKNSFIKLLNIVKYKLKTLKEMFLANICLFE